MSASASRATAADFRRWWPWLGWAALLLVAALALRLDFVRRSTVATISEQGSPRPPADARSPTGYALGQRYFLGAQERGDTFRWIAATQEMLATGPFVATTYLADNTPEGRPALAPRLYTAWLASLAWIEQALTQRPAGLAVESVALWEPILAHLVALAAATVFLTRRFGWRTGLIGGFFLCLFPAFSAQYLPGVLSPRPWAMLLAAWAFALVFFWAGPDQAAPGNRQRDSVVAGLATGVALWLDPAIGFPLVLITAAAGLFLAFLRPGAVPWLRWAFAGAAMVLLAWGIDRGPLRLTAGELRYVHPLYAVAWLGIGLLLHGIQTWRAAALRRLAVAWPALLGVALLAAAAIVQFRAGFLGWLYPAVALLHLSSLDEALPPAAHVLAAMRAAPRADWFFTLAPALASVALLGAAVWCSRRTARFPGLLFGLGLFLGLLVLAYFRVRWWSVVSALTLPLGALLLPSLPALLRRIALGAIGSYLAALALWQAPALLATSRPVEPAAADVEAMVFRHFTYWLVGHTPPDSVSALATPALSDALVYHGGCRVLVSTAWESHPGLVAAARILSAPDSDEVEGILQRRALTHVVVNSWDQVLAQFVRAPEAHRNETFHAQLQRWVFPRYLRPVPYRLPAGAGFAGQVIAVLRTTAPQDEALALSRLAEYFVEMDRDYLANAAARILGQAHADDPNALIARAVVLHHTGDRAGFERELTQLATRSAPGKIRLDWDRRVQRAIVFALGARHDLARPEIAACAAALDENNLRDLTALQTFRFLKLADSYGVRLPRPELRALAESLCAEYAPKKEP